MPQRKIRMKTRRHIAYLLFVVNILMLAVPVIPHHHHADGILCMKSDIEAGCCNHSANKAGEHCCCNTGCITTHFFQQRPTLDIDFTHTFPDNTPFYSASLLSPFIFLTPSGQLRENTTYMEVLHGTFFTRAKGLRAPPTSNQSV